MPESLREALRRLRRHRLWQPAAYLAVGGWNTLFGLGLYALAFRALHAHVQYLVLLVLCNIVAITNAYVCYKRLVFRTRGNWLREYLRFYVVYGTAAFLGMGLVAVGVQMFGMHPVWANTAVTGLTIIISYFGHRRVSFAPRRPAAGPLSTDVSSVASKE